jgi:hypothetical protein
MFSFILGIINFSGSTNLLIFITQKYNWLFLIINNFSLIYCLLNLFVIKRRERNKGCLEFFGLTLCLVAVIISSVRYIINNGCF